MVNFIPVSIYEGEHDVFFESETGFFVRITNTVSHGNPDSLWYSETVDGEAYYYPHINESQAYLTTPWQHDFEEEPVSTGGSVELVELPSSDLYLVGRSNAIPAYSPYYLFDRENEEIYSVHNAFIPADFDGDDLLEFDAQDGVVAVENERTGYSRPMDADSIVDRMGDRFEYALPIRVPSN